MENTLELRKEIFQVNGMTCMGCVKTVKSVLEQYPKIVSAEVNLSDGQADITYEDELDLSAINASLKASGAYSIQPKQNIALETSNVFPQEELPEKSLTTYKPLLLIVAFIAGVSALIQFPFDSLSVMQFMRHFMAGFFLVFSFFKLLNIKGFADSYAMYDLLAAKWRNWGYIYPFVELVLGLLYLTNQFPILTNSITALVLGFSSIGVIKSNLDKRKIKCACLGDVFNLPMSTVTIVEDVSMVAMAIIMLIYGV